MGEYDQQEILKDLQQMVNEISEKIKTLAESKKTMKEELSILQEDLENITEDDLQYLNSKKLEEQIKFQESLLLLQAGMLIFVSKWMMISMYTLPMNFYLKNQQRR